jgi:hypothetical protein
MSHSSGVTPSLQVYMPAVWGVFLQVENEV